VVEKSKREEAESRGGNFYVLKLRVRLQTGHAVIDRPRGEKRGARVLDVSTVVGFRQGGT